MTLEICGRKIGPDRPPYFIAEIGANHDGSLDRALRLIELAVDAGADAIKFQHFSAPTIVSRRGFAELGKIAHQTTWETGVYEAYEKASIPTEWTEYLASYTHDHGVAFITTPYSLELVDHVEPYVDACKIGSGDITYHELIRYIAGKGKPVLLATGASLEREVWKAVNVTWDAAPNVEVALLQCNTNYEGGTNCFGSLNLRVIRNWNGSSVGVVGLSDHTPGHLAATTAIALGASIIEKHFTDDPGRVGPDHAFAMTPFEWKAMVENCRLVREALGDGQKKVEANEDARIVQRRALRYAVASMGAGYRVQKLDVIATRPCPEGALEPYRIDEVVGRKLKRDVEVDELIRLEDLE